MRIARGAKTGYTRGNTTNSSNVPVLSRGMRRQQSANIPRQYPTEKKSHSFNICCCCGSENKRTISGDHQAPDTPEQMVMNKTQQNANDGKRPSQNIEIHIHGPGSTPEIKQNSVDADLGLSYSDPIHSVRISPCDLVTPRLQSRMIS